MHKKTSNNKQFYKFKKNQKPKDEIKKTSNHNKKMNKRRKTKMLNQFD